MDFFDEYFKYVGDSEAPKCFHRWCALSTLGAVIGRNAYFPFGHDPLYPNQYILLMGAPGTRKSSAISISKKVLRKVGYSKFAKDRTSIERFFIDMVPKFDGEADLEALVLDAASEILISNGEFLDFLGQGNLDFLVALTNLWDNLPIYEHPKIHGKSVVVLKPTINILGGATVKGLGMMIPPEAIGTGTLSRVLLIHSEMTDNKITFPRDILDTDSDQVVECLLKIQTDIKGKIDKDKNAAILLDRMYKTSPGIEDSRFSDYASRRFTHLLKITMLVAISSHRQMITGEDALIANTLLHAAELRMSKSLGEFGKSKFSDVSNSIMEVLAKAHKPMTHVELWKIVAKDLSDMKDMGTIMKNLITSEKVQVLTMAGKQGYMPLHRITREWKPDLLLEDYLTEGE